MVAQSVVRSRCYDVVSAGITRKPRGQKYGRAGQSWDKLADRSRYQAGAT
jgi:hypothetical protein